MEVNAEVCSRAALIDKTQFNTSRLVWAVPHKKETSEDAGGQRVDVPARGRPAEVMTKTQELMSGS